MNALATLVAAYAVISDMLEADGKLVMDALHSERLSAEERRWLVEQLLGSLRRHAQALEGVRLALDAVALEGKPGTHGPT